MLNVRHYCLKKHPDLELTLLGAAGLTVHQNDHPIQKPAGGDSLQCNLTYYAV